jgi:hypothetical protein
MTPTPRELADLTGEIMSEFPRAEIHYDPLPSGVRFLRVYLGRRSFCLEYHPTKGTGVCELTSETTPFDHAYDDHFFTSVGEAATFLKSILADAMKTEEKHLPKAYVPTKEMAPAYVPKKLFSKLFK